MYSKTAPEENSRIMFQVICKWLYFQLSPHLEKLQTPVLFIAVLSEKGVICEVYFGGTAGSDIVFFVTGFPV